ncbi:MAG TPA: hypothetical protein VFK80_05570 [Limnochordia bacterium]|nr:hypothetical protein [Limnochordia bacterium]
MRPLAVQAGFIFALRLFDVAYEIDLNRVEQILSRREGVTRIRLSRAKPKAIVYRVQPLEVRLGQIQLGDSGEADAVARLYDFGAIAVVLRFRIAHGTEWAELTEKVNRIEAAAEHSAVFQEELERLMDAVRPALTRPAVAPVQEDYLVTFIHAFDEAIDADELQRRVDIPALLSGESREIAESARRDLMRHTFSYYRDDLVVMTWDRALVVEPSGERDVADILEVANTQLLELRYFDDVLDAELPRMYDRVEHARSRFGAWSGRRYARLARELNALVGQVTEVVEKADNALKVTEDVYLARVYGAALELFRTRTWTASVHRKLDIIRETYTALNDEAVTLRSQAMELAIVLLIVVEIVFAFLPHK